MQTVDCLLITSFSLIFFVSSNVTYDLGTKKLWALYICIMHPIHDYIWLCIYNRQCLPEFTRQKESINGRLKSFLLIGLQSLWLWSKPRSDFITSICLFVFFFYQLLCISVGQNICSALSKIRGKPRWFQISNQLIDSTHWKKI